MSKAMIFMLTIASVWLSGCGWETKIRVKSPFQKASIEIQQPFPANGWGFRIQLETTNPKSLYRMKGDVFLDFATITWARDRVAVFTCGTPELKLAYNVTDGSYLDFVQMQSAVTSQIRSEYGLPKADDKTTLEWACSLEGRDAFIRRYPQAKQR